MKHALLPFVLLLAMLACSVQVSPAVLTLPTVQPTTKPLPTVQPTVFQTNEFTTVGNVYIRETPGGTVIGSLTSGESVTGVCAGAWCELQAGGFVWRGCTDDNPESLGCSNK